MKKLVISLLVLMGVSGFANAEGDAEAGKSKAAVCAGCSADAVLQPGVPGGGAAVAALAGGLDVSRQPGGPGATAGAESAVSRAPASATRSA